MIAAMDVDERMYNARLDVLNAPFTFDAAQSKPLEELGAFPRLRRDLEVLIQWHRLESKPLEIARVPRAGERTRREWERLRDALRRVEGLAEEIASWGLAHRLNMERFKPHRYIDVSMTPLLDDLTPWREASERLLAAPPPGGRREEFLRDVLAVAVALVVIRHQVPLSRSRLYRTALRAVLDATGQAIGDKAFSKLASAVAVAARRVAISAPLNAPHA
ncbi:MAG: hypothetical protein LAO51_10085 [Acidobacteriia bacterium]|nr:hypothetical protein [Terriglobia bacterium]